MPEPQRDSASTAAIRVVLADDSVLFREGLARLLADNGFVIAAQAGDADELHAAVHREAPDVVVTDIRMPPTNTNEGLLAAQRIRAEHPSVGVLVLSHYVETRQAIKLLQDAPQRVGYLLKDRVSDITEFTEAVRRIARLRGNHKAVVGEEPGQPFTEQHRVVGQHDPDPRGRRAASACRRVIGFWHSGPLHAPAVWRWFRHRRGSPPGRRSRLPIGFPRGSCRGRRRPDPRALAARSHG